MKKERWNGAIELFNLRPDIVEANWRFSWEIGWCYFKLSKFETARKHMIRATELAPENPICKWGLGTVYLKRKHFKKAETVLAEALRIKDSGPTRAALALAYLSQGKASEAEDVHLEGIRLKPKSSRRYDHYAAFLSDVGREPEAQATERKGKKLRRVN
jgi:Flp pilus assembly protein TadD